MSSAATQWWSSLKLWEQYTLGFSGLVILVFLLAFIKLFALRRAKIREDYLEAERARIYKLHPEVLEKRIGVKVSDVPFGVRALEVGVVVEGVWTSTPMDEKIAISTNMNGKEPEEKVMKDDVKVSVVSAAEPSLGSGCTTPTQIYGIEEARIQNILSVPNPAQTQQMSSPLLDPEAGMARQAALAALNGQREAKTPRTYRPKSKIEDRPFRYHSPKPARDDRLFWSGRWLERERKGNSSGIIETIV